MSSRNSLHLPFFNNIKSILNKYVDNLYYPLNFEKDILSYSENDLIEECEHLCKKISKEIKELLVMKLVLKEKKMDINEKLENEIDERIKNELLINKNENVYKLFENSYININQSNYLKIGKEGGLDDNNSIIKYF